MGKQGMEAIDEFMGGDIEEELKSSLEPEPPKDTPPEEPPEEPKDEEPKAEEPLEEPPQEKNYEEMYSNVSKALKEEREKNAATAQQIAELERKQERYDKVMQALEQSRERRQQASDEERFNENPAAYLREQQERLRQEIHQTREQDQQSQAFNAEMNAIAASAQTFKQATPDYDQAMDYLREQRFAEYEFYGVPENQREQAWNQECVQFGQMALRQGQDPAARAYQYAQQRGFKPPETPAAGGQPPAADDKTEGKSRLQAMQEGQRASGTLEGGSAPDESETFTKMLDDMTDEEFEAYYAKLEQEAKKQH